MLNPLCSSEVVNNVKQAGPKLHSSGAVSSISLALKAVHKKSGKILPFPCTTRIISLKFLSDMACLFYLNKYVTKEKIW